MKVKELYIEIEEYLSEILGRYPTKEEIEDHIKHVLKERD